MYEWIQISPNETPRISLNKILQISLNETIWIRLYELAWMWLYKLIWMRQKINTPPIHQKQIAKPQTAIRACCTILLV